jgi:phospholipase/carboxylesterase
LTFEFGSRYHKVLSGYIAISGYIYYVVKLLEEMNRDVKNARWLCTHGTYDNVLAFESSKKQVQTLQNAGFDVEFRAYEKDHSLDREELAMISEWIQASF